VYNSWGTKGICLKALDLLSVLRSFRSLPFWHVLHICPNCCMSLFLIPFWFTMCSSFDTDPLCGFADRRPALLALFMSIHSRLGTGSTISKAGLTAEDLCLIFESMAMQMVSRRKLVAFQYWHILTTKNMDRFWVTQDQLVKLFDTISLSPPRIRDIARRQPCSQGVLNESEWMKQCIAAVLRKQVTSCFELRILGSNTEIRLSLISLESNVGTNTIRICILRGGEERNHNNRHVFIHDVLLLVGEGEICCGDLDLEPGSYILIVCCKVEHLFIRLTIYSSRSILLRGMPRDIAPRLDLHVGHIPHTNWSTPMVEFVDDTWSRFKFQSVNIHPILFHRLRQRTCGICYISTFCFLFLFLIMISISV
jgi:hypothetical protein